MKIAEMLPQSPNPRLPLSQFYNYPGPDFISL